ncbi:MAG: Pyrimidine-nucleoside phosphorylase [Verrucomicrobia bacterium ADurb.Bin070]|nr:MAG: Pyrimidine-nucleoside phosphorylase [Verrucomicrobia bacterium ADurb.Bin070]
MVAEVGCSIIGQTARLAPADKKLYALRDVTGTVPSIPLITASIMSKKLAEGADTLVFDVKCGRAAFMQTPDAARELARSLLRVGRALGRRMGALITDMEQPLGRTAGNAVEVAEAIETLKGGGPADTRALTIELTALMCERAGVLGDRASARRALAERLDDGRALEVFRRMVEAHGGDARVIDEPLRLPQPGAVLEVPAPRDGIVAGEPVARGQPLMRLLARDAARAGALLQEAAAAVRLGAAPPAERKLVIEEVGEGDVSMTNSQRSTFNAQRSR